MTNKLTYEDFVIDRYKSLRNDFLEQNMELFAAYCQDIYDEVMLEEDKE